MDWYHQRVELAGDEELRAVLAHNRDEEIEHAAMKLEWLRRNMNGWNHELREYLFTEAPITEPISLGNLHTTSLLQVLQGESYRRFVAPLQRRCEADRRFQAVSSASSSWGSVAIRELDAAHRELEASLSDSPFPDSCRACHKVRGW